jgi:hypothetical protein
MAAVHGTLCMISPRNNNQYHHRLQHPGLRTALRSFTTHRVRLLLGMKPLQGHPKVMPPVLTPK